MKQTTVRTTQTMLQQVTTSILTEYLNVELRQNKVSKPIKKLKIK